MKKFLKIILISSLIGTMLAAMFFFNIKDKAEAKNKTILYAFQVGVFKSLENADNFKTRFEASKIYKDNEYYRVFVGVTINNKEMLESIFNNLGYDYYIKELDKIENVEEILKYDELLKESNEENKMIIIKNMLESFSYGL